MQVNSHPVTPSVFAETSVGEDGCTSTPAPSEVYDADLRRTFQEYACFGARDAPGAQGMAVGGGWGAAMGSACVLTILHRWRSAVALLLLSRLVRRASFWEESSWPARLLPNVQLNCRDWVDVRVQAVARQP